MESNAIKDAKFELFVGAHRILTNKREKPWTGNERPFSVSEQQYRTVASNKVSDRPILQDYRFLHSRSSSSQET